MRNKIIFYTLLFLNFSCSPTHDIENWVKKQKNNIVNTKNKYKVNNKKKTKYDFKLKEVNYNIPNNNTSPFDNSRLKLDVKSGRQKEILEDFNLSDLKYLGYFIKNNIPTAYIKAKNLIYNVHVGNYIGKNDGKIVDIIPNKIIIDELIVNNNGESFLNENEILISNSILELK